MTPRRSRNAPRRLPRIEDYHHDDVVYIGKWPCILKENGGRRLVARYIGCPGETSRTDRITTLHVNDTNKALYRSHNLAAAMREAKQILKARGDRWGSVANRNYAPSFVERHVRRGEYGDEDPLPENGEPLLDGLLEQPQEPLQLQLQEPFEVQLEEPMPEQIPEPGPVVEQEALNGNIEQSIDETNEVECTHEEMDEEDVEEEPVREVPEQQQNGIFASALTWVRGTFFGA